MADRRETDRRCEAAPVDAERRQGERRGRPRSLDPTEVLTLRVTVSQRQKLTAVASMNGMSLSAFVREAIEEAAADCSDDRIFQ